MLDWHEESVVSFLGGHDNGVLCPGMTECSGTSAHLVPDAAEHVHHQALVEFCCDAKGAQVHPTRAELEALSARCLDADPLSLSATLVDQLSWAASGDLSWQPRLRALVALVHFAAQEEGSLRQAAVITLDETTHVLNHLVAAVPQCRRLALDALMLLDDLQFERNAQEDEQSLADRRGEQPHCSNTDDTAKAARGAAPGPMESPRPRPESFYLMRRWQGPLRAQLRQRQLELQRREQEIAQQRLAQPEQPQQSAPGRPDEWVKSVDQDPAEPMVGVERSTSTEGSADECFERSPGGHHGIPSAHIGDDDRLCALDLL